MLLPWICDQHMFHVEHAGGLMEFSHVPRGTSSDVEHESFASCAEPICGGEKGTDSLDRSSDLADTCSVKILHKEHACADPAPADRAPDPSSGTGRSGGEQGAAALRRMSQKPGEAGEINRSHELAVIMHELRNALTPAVSYAQLANRSPYDQMFVRRALDRIAASLANAIAIIDETEPKKHSPYTKQNTNLCAVLQQLLLDLEPSLDRQGVGVDLHLPAAETPRVDDKDAPGDREVAITSGPCRQALMNVLLNAIQAMAVMPEPCVKTLSITVDERAEPGYLRLLIQDTGPGIPMEILPHLFEPFQTMRQGGTGLGLAITRSLIEGAGGRITASNLGDDERPTGACVEIVLPLATASPALNRVLPRALRKAG